MPELGFAADVYGPEYRDVQDFQLRIKLSSKWRNDPVMFSERIQAGINALKSHPNVDPNNIAIIRYCFGGTGVLAYSFLNTNSDDKDSSSNIVGAVSFHGGLIDFPTTSTTNPNATMLNPVLVLSGGNDDTGTDVEELERKLDAVRATWQITRYSGKFSHKENKPVSDSSCVL